MQRARSAGSLERPAAVAVQGPPGVDLALRTFAFGLFSLPEEVDEALDPPAQVAGSGPACEFPDEERWERVEAPVEIAGAQGFTSLSGGWQSCLGVTPEGDVYRWDAGGRGAAVLARGFGVDWSLTGLKDDMGHQVHLRDVAIGYAAHHTLKRFAGKDAEGVCSPGAPAAPAVPAVAAVALMDNGDVYTTNTWYASAAEAGSSRAQGPAWLALAPLRHRLVVSVACGLDFCAALTAPGELWTWGESRSGSLGQPLGALGQSDTIAEPTRVLGELGRRRVAAVACGESHVVAATFDEPGDPGAVFSWGSAADVRLGYDLGAGEAVQREPREVPWLTPALGEALRARRHASPRGATTSPQHRPNLRAPQRITQLSCGARHSVVLCQGAVICFGADDCKQLGRTMRGGRGDELDDGALPPFACAPALADEAAAGEATARRICCGPLHTAAVSSDGSLHIWGLQLQGKIPPGSSGGAQRVLGFGGCGGRPVVALACGAHFVLVSAEVELPTLGTRMDSPARDAAQGAHAAHAWHAWHAWRPANLPPKRVEESLRHQTLVRELEQNMYRRLEREQREEEQRREREERRECRLKEHTEIWLKHLLPPFVPGSQPSRQMERLWRQGLPPRVREVLWPMAIGNVLRITPELFDIHRQQALDARRADAADAAAADVAAAEGHTKKMRSAKCIPLDLPRTFPTLAFFAEGGPLHEDCGRILEAYTFFRPDIGYVQGMSYLAAMLLLYLPLYPAFVGLCNLLNSPSVLGLYRLEPRAVECRARVFQQLCSAHLPAVARVIIEAGLTPEMFLIEWFMTLYSKCLAIDVASVVWDLFFLDGEVVLYCTALALLRMSEAALLGSGRGGAGPADLEACARILGEDVRQRAGDPDEVLWHVHEVWRRAPSQLLAEIRSIENTEFGLHLHGGSSGSARSAQAAAAAGFLGLQQPRAFLGAVFGGFLRPA